MTTSHAPNQTPAEAAAESPSTVAIEPAVGASNGESRTRPPTTNNHRDLREGEFWRRIPAYADIDRATFLDHRWQGRNVITKSTRLIEAVKDLAPANFVRDAEAGFQMAPMSVRVTPYLMSVIDWDHPYDDPVRTQFIPLASHRIPDHPNLTLDSLNEQGDSPVMGLVHRYPDKALFLALNTCPVYCRFCTRSYAVGLDTEDVDKLDLHADTSRWESDFAYIEAHPDLEDLVVSGGDVYNLPAKHIRALGLRLLSIPHVQRIRFATKGPAVLPQKILSDEAWFDAIVEVVETGRRMHKDVALHTHFNHPNEITWITRAAMNKLHERGVVIRNQSVLLRGVNDTVEAMRLLIKRLGSVNVHPYYVYVCDLVHGVEDMRTTLATALELEKQVRGLTAGFNTPTFVVDTLGGGGKRDAHSFEYYDQTTGVAVYRSPNVDPDRLFYYFDPVCQLAPDVQAKWQDPVEQKRMTFEARSRAQAGLASR